MNKQNQPAIDTYMKKIFEIMIIVIPLIAIFAGATFTVLKLLGFYATVPMAPLLAFDASCVAYLIVGVVILKRCELPNGVLKPNAVLIGKIFIAVLVFIQWNFISHLIPSSEFWAYSIFFVLVTVFFLDSKLVLAAEVEVAVSMLATLFFHPDGVYIAKDEFFIPNTVLRIVVIVLAFVGLYLLSFLIEKLLVVELEHVSDYDTLTMLRNKKYLHRALELAIADQSSHGHLSILLCDLDDFSFINKNYGFECGDFILKTMADEMFIAVGNSGKTYRYEGDQVVVMTSATGEMLTALADSLRFAISQRTVKFDGMKINVTMTVGGAEYKEGESVESFISRASENLKKGKRSCKNTTVV